MEAAELEGINYETMKKKLQRNPENYITEIRMSTSGGNKKTFISIDSLSKKARRTYKEKLAIENQVGNMIVDEKIGDEIPWYVGIDYQEYIENNKKIYYKSVELNKNIEEFLKYTGTGKTEYAEEFAKKLGMSKRTLFRKTKVCLEASAWAIKMSERDGKNYNFYKVFALCNKPKTKGTYPSLTPQEKAYIENMCFDPMFNQNNCTVAMVYDAYLKKCSDEGWEPSSPATIYRYANELEEKNSSAKYLLKNGVRKWKGNKMLKAHRDTAALQVMEIVQGDTHTFDCWVSVERANGTKNIIRPVVAAFIDTRSRCYVGWGVAETINAQLLKEIMINMMYEKEDPEVPFYGVPKYLLIDNGKDYTAETLTGRKRTERASFDMETKGFFRSIGIIDDMRSLPYQAWGKAQVERGFRTVCNTFSKCFESYTGTLTGSKTSDKVKKDINKLYEQGKIPTIEEFTEKFEKWVKQYHNKIHSGLKSQKESMPMPIEVYKNAERYIQAPPPMSYAEMLLMKSSGARVYTTGIKRFGTFYNAEELGNYVDKHVTIRWNPSDMSKIYVYENNGKKVCEAQSEELLKMGPKITEESLTKHIKKQKRQLRSLKDDINKYQMTYEERLEAEQQELSEEKPLILQKLKEGNPRVVALTEDRQFRNELKEKKNKLKEPIKNEFFEQQAEDAFAMLENL